MVEMVRCKSFNAVIVDGNKLFIVQPHSFSEAQWLNPQKKKPSILKHTIDGILNGKVYTWDDLYHTLGYEIILKDVSTWDRYSDYKRLGRSKPYHRKGCRRITYG